MQNLRRFVVAGILGCLFSSLLFAGGHHGRVGAAPVNHPHPSSYLLPALSERDASYLGTMFLPNSIPKGGIAVLENSLGDIVHDSVVNILDLLRLRDIVTGQPPSPSSYESSESDLTHDGRIDQSDISLMRDILLRKVGVPYLVDSAGGQVYADGITLIIPPGAVDSTITISLRRTSESEFASEFGVDTKSAVEDSAYFMAGFRIISSTPDFKLPVDATVKLDSIPPCAYQGLNGLFAAVPDRDGDGKSELFLINELQLNTDSLTLITKDIPVPVINALSSSQVEPGKQLVISGRGFTDNPQNINVEFRSVSTDSSQSVLPSGVNDTSIALIAPGFPSGQYILTVDNVLTGTASNPALIEILPPGAVSGDIRSIIVNFFMQSAAAMDSVRADSLFRRLEDSTVGNFFIDLRRSVRAGLDSTISFFQTVEDSVINEFAPLAAFIQNLTSIRKLERVGKGPMDDPCAMCDPYLDKIDELKKSIAARKEDYNFFAAKCLAGKGHAGLPCFWCDGAEEIRTQILDMTDLLAGEENAFWDCACRNCGGKDCDNCKQANFVGFGPKGKISGGFGGGGYHTDGVCVNIKKYNPNECATAPVRIYPFSPVPLDKPAGFKCPPLLKPLRSGMIQSLSVSRPNAGSIVRITNAPVPYNIVGILSDNGNAFIPHVPFNTKVTFSIYDPVTGFYDPAVGTYTTGSTAGVFDHPILLFKPNTTIRMIGIHIGEVVRDSLSFTAYQRTDYILNIGGADTSSFLSIGFRSSVPMTLRIEDPDGGLLVDSINTACYSEPKLKLGKIGPYRIRISFGTGLLPGAYSFGISYYPEPPIDRFYMCGRFIHDTLWQVFSPYLISDPVTVPLADTIFVESGVTLAFDHNGSVLSYGTLFGTGTHDAPIRLQPFGGVSLKNVVNRDRSAGIVTPEGKEKQP